MRKNFILSESDLQALFAAKNRHRPQSRFRQFFSLFTLFLILYLVVFTAINFGALREKLRWWYENEYKSAPQIKSPPLASEEIKQIQSAPSALPDNYIRIKSIDVTAPIIWRVENEDSAARKALQNGVAHINGTALPGEIGNVFITGHSSDLPWSKGNYKNVFALLSKLVVGDQIELKYQNREYVYRVFGSKVVEATEISVMEPTKQPILSLMTCTPVGTTLRRLVVTAAQIKPDPALNLPQAQTQGQKRLPRSR